MSWGPLLVWSYLCPISLYFSHDAFETFWAAYPRVSCPMALCPSPSYTCHTEDHLLACLSLPLEYELSEGRDWSGVCGIQLSAQYSKYLLNEKWTCEWANDWLHTINRGAMAWWLSVRKPRDKRPAQDITTRKSHRLGVCNLQLARPIQLITHFYVNHVTTKSFTFLNDWKNQKKKKFTMCEN